MREVWRVLSPCRGVCMLLGPLGKKYMPGSQRAGGMVLMWGVLLGQWQHTPGQYRRLHCAVGQSRPVLFCIISCAARELEKGWGERWGRVPLTSAQRGRKNLQSPIRNKHEFQQQHLRCSCVRCAESWDKRGDHRNAATCYPKCSLSSSQSFSFFWAF